MNEQIILGTVTSTSKNQSGRRRLSVSFDFADYESEQKDLFDTMFKELPVQVAVAIVTNEAAVKATQDVITTSEYGKYANMLKLSSFFRTPKVWSAIGSDSEYLEWIRNQRCCICKGNLAISSSEAAHVRRVANGSGIGIKPTYSAIPLCHTHHTEQHKHGESAIGGREFVDKMRIKYIQNWGWETLKKKFGYESWKNICPTVLIKWAEEHDIKEYLPTNYLNIT